MNDAFEKKVRAAAVAGWWTLLIAVLFVTLQWLTANVLGRAWARSAGRSCLRAPGS